MIDPTSRYALIPTATYATADGHEVRYLRRRFAPLGARILLAGELTVTDGERLDLIAARTLGDPTRFWRIADANDAMNPPELTAASGRVLRIPTPQGF